MSSLDNLFEEKDKPINTQEMFVANRIQVERMQQNNNNIHTCLAVLKDCSLILEKGTKLPKVTQDNLEKVLINASKELRTYYENNNGQSGTESTVDTEPGEDVSEPEG